MTEALAKRSSNPGPSNTQAVDGCDYFWQPPAWVISDPTQQIVEGYASLPNLDDQGDVIPLDAIAEALPEYMEFGNLREMHTKSAAGNVLKAHIDEKGLYIVAKVEDPGAWAKVKAGVYKGFSVGGDIPEDATEQRADGARLIKQIRLNEISLVDRPANKKALISIVKFEKWSGGREVLSEKWTAGRTKTMMHARGIKRHKSKCEKHKKEDCEECGCDRTVEHPGTGATSGMADRPTQKSLNAAAERLGKKQKDIMKLLQVAKSVLADPEQIEVLEKAEKILAESGVVEKAQEWHTQRDVGNPNSEAEVGVDLEDNDAGGEEPVEDVIDKAKAPSQEPNQEPVQASEKADGSPMSHMQACHKSLTACHKALDGDHPAKAHAAAALEHCSKAMKCFGNKSAASTSTIVKAVAVDGAMEDRIEQIEQSVQFIANALQKVADRVSGLPKSRAPMPRDTEAWNKDDEARAARLAMTNI